MRRAGVGAARLDWDATVREAFLTECVKQGVRAQLATEALGDAHDEPTSDALRAVINDATRRAGLGWLTIETCLEQFGELAALALERSVEEAAVATAKPTRARSYLRDAAANLTAGPTPPRRSRGLDREARPRETGAILGAERDFCGLGPGRTSQNAQLMVTIWCA